jgi:RNA polymerase sigma-70 factor (ECF subfamily)
LEAARQWDRYRGKGSREAWLFGIARNQARLHRRWWKRRREEPLDEDLALPTPPAEVTSGEDEVRMWNAIQELPPLYRQTLLLRLADELSYEEIAAALDVPLGTVRSRIHEAVRRLRAQLSPDFSPRRHRGH